MPLKRQGCCGSSLQRIAEPSQVAAGECFLDASLVTSKLTRQTRSRVVSSKLMNDGQLAVRGQPN